MQLLLALALVTTALGGCAGRGLQVAVTNDPSPPKIIGNNVFAGFHDGENLNTTLQAKKFASFAEDWLRQNGYQIVGSPEHADFVVILSASSSRRDVHVPGGHRMIPVWDPGDTYHGSAVGPGGSVSTQVRREGQWRREAVYMEGYVGTVTDRWLFCHIYARESGRKPQLVSEGQVYPKTVDRPFFEHDGIMTRAVKALLRKTILAQ